MRQFLTKKGMSHLPTHPVHPILLPVTFFPEWRKSSKKKKKHLAEVEEVKKKKKTTEEVNGISLQKFQNCFASHGEYFEVDESVDM